MTQTMRETEIQIFTPSLQMPNAASTAEDVMSKTLEFCAQKTGAKDHGQVIDRLQAGDAQTHSYCHYGIASQLGAALGALDENIKTVYLFDYDATPEDLCFGDARRTPLVHLLVWTERKTQALDSLIKMLDRAMAESYANKIGPSRMQHILDVQVIDDADVAQRTGYGGLLHSIHYRPLKVWEHA
jgi:hypothetical protein